jgi:uncharacterized NAD(P)/FAD-binding protein YdhS
MELVMKTVAIVGGGFCGTLAAVNLVRLSSSPIQIHLINDKHPLGRGVAFGTTRQEHILNVAARNMSAVPDHPNHFLEWLRTRSDYRNLPEPQLRETFVPRRIYGDYLRGLLQNYLQPIDEHHPATITIHENEAVDIEVAENSSARIFLDDGQTLDADRVLLATGNQPPATIPTSDGFSHPGYSPDPWSDWIERIPDPASDIVVLGTGLSMIDTFLTLSEIGWTGRMVAVSRNGMIPHAHFRGIEYPNFLPENPETLDLAELVSLLENHCKQLRNIGENPGIVVDRLRPFTQRIWQQFSLENKQDFFKHYAARWNVIRHRIAQPVHQRVTEAITDGSLQVVKGTINSLAERDNQVLVNVDSPSNGPIEVLGGLVINCTGPKAGFSGTTTALYQNLLTRGSIRPDELDMGLEVGSDFAVISSDGVRSDTLSAIGPLMKGTLWESTAVPELRGQAMRVAQLLVDEASETTSTHDYRFSVKEEHVIEFYI